jgi:hypothetical protein
LFVNHKGEDSHLSGTALVELDGKLGELGLLIERVPSLVDGSVTEVSREFGFTGEVLRDRRLKDSNEEKELDKATISLRACTSDILTRQSLDCFKIRLAFYCYNS